MAWPRKTHAYTHTPKRGRNEIKCLEIPQIYSTTKLNKINVHSLAVCSALTVYTRKEIGKKEAKKKAEEMANE